MTRSTKRTSPKDLHTRALALHNGNMKHPVRNFLSILVYCLSLVGSLWLLAFVAFGVALHRGVLG